MKKLTPKIIFQNKDYLVLDKPAGLICHSDGKSCTPSLADWLIEEKLVAKSVGEPHKIPIGTNEKSIVSGCKLPTFTYQKTQLSILRPGIVHRLDRDTSGVMLVARTKSMYAYFKKCFKRRDVQKMYRAFVVGTLPKPVMSIATPIARSTTDFRKWRAGNSTRGEAREALTHIRLLKTFKAGGKTYSYIEAAPKTGRTHQIRVHLAHIGRPIAGDSLYGSRDNALGFNRPALHAWKLSFKNQAGKKEEFVAPLPADFLEAEKCMQK